MEKTLRTVERFIPKKLYRLCQPAYHSVLAFVSACTYRFPSRRVKVIGVTGTKGKSSTVEIISAILEEAGYKTAFSNTVRFKIGESSQNNLFKMSLPGRFFIQRFVRQAVNARCDYVILEMTSQGYLQSRHKFISFDAFVVTNISPEHIESHGSYENYIEAKVSLARTLEKSVKPNRALILNADDKEINRFRALKIDNQKMYGIADGSPYTLRDLAGIDFTFRGVGIHSPLSGLFNLYNILAAATLAENQGIDINVIKKAVEKFAGVRGRVEKIEAGQDFTVIVDYAHTTDSLEKLYKVFGNKDKKVSGTKQTCQKICVLGGTGGGRDKWKRKEMGTIADDYCDQIILTIEDPYDEDPLQIIHDVAEGVTKHKPTIIMDRREAIQNALTTAKTGDVVLITGKGTDPFIMGAHGNNIPWSDANVVREELGKLKNK